MSLAQPPHGVVDRATLPAGARSIRADEARALNDDELIGVQAALADERRRVDASVAVVAAEIARRSRRDLGHSGLAQRRGARTAESLVAGVTGLSTSQSRRLVEAGDLLAAPAPGHEPLARAVEHGTLSVEAAHVIRAALGDAGRVPAERLRSVAKTLVDESAGVPLERLAAQAREARAAMDVDSVPLREHELRERRFLSLTPQPDGMTRVAGLLDPESAAIIVGAIDAATSPRRGGPRFVDPTAQPQHPEDDERTVPQMLADALVDLVALATRADTGTVLGARRVGIRVHVTARDLAAGAGFAIVEGQSALVSVATATRISCDTGIVPIAFDSDERVLNVGRTQRHHTPRMRVALAARDGGCTMPGCSRPPEWCEAHHIHQWHRDRGETSVEDGVLLCRHHHQALHHHGWRITRDGTTYLLHRDGRSPVPLQHRNPLARRLT